MTDADELCYAPAAVLADAIRAGRLSPVEVVRAFLTRIEAVNPGLNAYCTVAADAALAAARAAEAALRRGGPVGLLHGVPVAIKDTTETAGLRTTYGSRIFEHHVPSEDAVVVERLRRAGAIILGKTNTPEFACKGTTDNPLFGPTRNPWDYDRVAGGSSGGSAAAVAAGLAPLAEGSDVAGSIRIPASCCGVVGLKPSLGRVPCFPALNGWTGFMVHGPLARTVRDAALFLTAVAGADDRDPQSVPLSHEDFARASEAGAAGLRIAWSGDLGYAPVEPEVRAIAETAVTAFRDCGASVEAADPGFDDPQDVFVTLSSAWRAGLYARHLPEWGDRMDRVLVQRMARTEDMTARAYEQAVHRRTALWHQVRRFFERYDLLVTPTTSVVAFPLSVEFPPEIAGRRLNGQLDWYPFTFPFNLTGHPAISVPCGWTRDGLPVGLQIVGRRFSEETVLAAAAAFEAARPWVGRRPALRARSRSTISRSGGGG